VSTPSLREVKQSIDRVRLLFTPSNAGSALGLQDQTLAAQQAGVSVIPIPFDSTADLTSRPNNRARKGAGTPTPAVIINRADCKTRDGTRPSALPSISFHPSMVQAGLLMSYADDRIASWRRAAQLRRPSSQR
jgi:hypothetical protein